jgi:hypothetical protein
VTTDPATTDFATGEHVNALVPNAIEPNEIVSVSGVLNRVTHAIEATELLVISRNRFLVSGLFTSVRPPTGPATTREVDLFVRSELPDISGITVGQIGTFSLNNSEAYWIAHLKSPLTTLLFNYGKLAAGQEVAIGGATDGGTSLTPKRVILLRQGQAGTWKPGSTVIVAGNEGSFQLNARKGIASLLLPDPLTVRTSPFTRFINLGGLGDLTGTEEIPVRAVGFILVNPANGQPTLVARAVEKLPLP